ncbi:uncharacterized protein LOC110478460 [Lonchura striata]
MGRGGEDPPWLAKRLWESLERVEGEGVHGVVVSGEGDVVGRGRVTPMHPARPGLRCSSRTWATASGFPAPHRLLLGVTHPVSRGTDPVSPGAFGDAAGRSSSPFQQQDRRAGGEPAVREHRGRTGSRYRGSPGPVVGGGRGEQGRGWGASPRCPRGPGAAVPPGTDRGRPASPGADKGGGTGTGTGRDGPGRAPPALLRRCPARCRSNNSIQYLRISNTSIISIQHHHHHNNSIQYLRISNTSIISIQHHHNNFIQYLEINNISIISIQHHHSSIQYLEINTTSIISIQHHHSSIFSQDTFATLIQCHHHGTDSIPHERVQIHRASTQLHHTASPILGQALWACFSHRDPQSHSSPWQLRSAPHGAEPRCGGADLAGRVPAGGGGGRAAGAALPARDPPLPAPG